jgi:hypothetical protein
MAIEVNNLKGISKKMQFQPWLIPLAAVIIYP